jgi:hypothetical protein
VGINGPIVDIESTVVRITSPAVQFESPPVEIDSRRVGIPSLHPGMDWWAVGREMLNRWNESNAPFAETPNIEVAAWSPPSPSTMSAGASPQESGRDTSSREPDGGEAPPSLSCDGASQPRLSGS